jgi:hypothetical protein
LLDGLRGCDLKSVPHVYKGEGIVMSEVGPHPAKRQRWGNRLGVILSLFGFSLYRTFRPRRPGRRGD